MADKFPTFESALDILSDPGHPDWFEASSYLPEQPETAQLIIEAFSATLTEMGIEPTGIDEMTGENAYSSADIARVMGIDVSELGVCFAESDRSVN